MQLTEQTFRIVKTAAEKVDPVDNFNQLQEECAELVVAVNHIRRDRIGWEEFAEECADVFLMINVLDQYLHILGYGELISRKVIEKSQKMALANDIEY